ncbi:MAG: hypothetical protein IJ686_00575 [Bacteroidales bacterium]|nr:hypothetical protein [Bacteroidales bacterium]
MKSRVFLTISIYAVLSACPALACGPYYFAPGEYYMYRGSLNYINNYYYQYEPKAEFNENSRENCLLWQRQTGRDIPLDDIYQVVYKSGIEDLENMGKATSLRKNPFFKYLKQDSEALDFLLLAKQCEKARSEMTSPWYYPSKKDPRRLSLDEVAGKSMSVRNGRFLGRYALQAERALLSLRRYDDCINFWNEVSGLLKDDVITKMAKRYVAGAYQRIGNLEMARRLFIEAGDGLAVAGITDTKGVCSLDVMYEYAPDTPELREEIGRIIQSGERLGADLNNCRNYNEQRSQLDSAKMFCLKVAREGRVKQPAFWYYSAAFISNLFGREAEASSTLMDAERIDDGDELIKESVKVLRIWLDAKLTPYSTSYEKRMVDNLRWLDERIVRDYTKVSKVTREDGMYLMKTNISYFYWNDMMRKVVLGAICPKLVENGRGDRAIAFANMADYRLLYTLEDCRAKKGSNGYDYSNESFKLIDTVGVNALKKYIAELQHPTTESSRFLNARGRSDINFYKEILGTQFLRNMRYAEAEQVFRTVPDSYKSRLNTYPQYFVYDPFSITKSTLKERSDCKLTFASRMADLKTEIATFSDPDRKALAMVKYATGMQQSVTRCWAYTFYGKNWDDSNPEYGLTNFSKTQITVSKKAEAIYLQALKTARDPEVLASIHLAFKNMATVIKQYAGTAAARSIEGKCDTYYDYHLERREHYDQNVWTQDYRW